MSPAPKKASNVTRRLQSVLADTAGGGDCATRKCNHESSIRLLKVVPGGGSYVSRQSATAEKQISKFKESFDVALALSSKADCRNSLEAESMFRGILLVSFLAIFCLAANAQTLSTEDDRAKDSKRRKALLPQNSSNNIVSRRIRLVCGTSRGGPAL